MKRASRKKANGRFAAQVLRALKRAAKSARKVAKMHGTPIAVLRNGKVVAQKP